MYLSSENRGALSTLQAVLREQVEFDDDKIGNLNTFVVRYKSQNRTCESAGLALKIGAPTGSINTEIL